LALANKGLAALDSDPHLANGLNVRGGKLMHPAVIDALGSLSAA
jgi:alanine dehydrogenase